MEFENIDIFVDKLVKDLNNLINNYNETKSNDVLKRIELRLNILSNIQDVEMKRQQLCAIQQIQSNGLLNKVVENLSTNNIFDMTKIKDLFNTKQE